MLRNILIVEDEPQMRKTIKGQLTRGHWNVTEAAPNDLVNKRAFPHRRY